MTDGLVAFLRAWLRSAAAYAGDDLCGCNAAACTVSPAPYPSRSVWPHRETARGKNA